ncbi:MAG: helix-turn-helix domain-containing protein [Dysgonomonas sp.]
MDTVIVTTESSLEKIIERIIDKRMPRSTESKIERTFSINQAAKMLKRSHKKISDLVASGILKCTTDRRIYESSIKEYNQK